MKEEIRYSQAERLYRNIGVQQFRCCIVQLAAECGAEPILSKAGNEDLDRFIHCRLTEVRGIGYSKVLQHRSWANLLFDDSPTKGRRRQSGEDEKSMLSAPGQP